MKTIKWLKISIVLQVIFSFFCISSSLCFAISRYFDMEIFFVIGNILIYGWVLNPLGLLSVIIGLLLFLSEKGIADNRKIIGNKWIWFILFFIIDLFLYLIAGLLTVAFTGGV